MLNGTSRAPVDAGDPVFIRLAHVEDLNAELRIIQRAFEFLHSDFVRMHSRGRGRRRNAAQIIW